MARRFNGFTAKQEAILASAPAKIEIHHGPVRTGKTLLSSARLYQNMLDALENESQPKFSAAAKGIPNCHRNIASSVRDVFGANLVPPVSDGAEAFTVKLSKGERMVTCPVRCLGWGTVHAEKGLYGWNIDGSVIDEVVMAPESLMEVNITRLDRPWARLICTTNPHSGRHWLKKNFIDKADGVYIQEYAWKLSDNPHLDEEYINMLRKTLHGVYYRRLVLGEWCSADGLIYPFLNESHAIKEPPCATQYIVGFDFGLKHKSAAVLVGVNPYCNPPAWVEREFVREPQDGLVFSLEDIVRDFWHWIGGIEPSAIYVDPSALVLKVALQRCNRSAPIVDANNDVSNGIHCVMSMISGREVAIGANCDRLLDEMYTYAWDSKKSDSSGRDMPVKENDDLCDALRYALYSHWGSTCAVARHTPVKEVSTPLFCRTDPLRPSYQQWQGRAY